MRYSVAQWIEFRGVRRGLVWQSDDETPAKGDTDGVLVDDGGRIVWARTPRELTELAEQYGVTLEEDVPSELVNLDGSEKLLALPISDDICNQLINAWNLLGDVARSVGASLDDRGADKDRCYEKLFAGMNLKIYTAPGEHYAPHFKKSEKRLIKEVFNRGRIILDARLQERTTAQEQAP
ncbi:hypothetical protein [Arthrobacter cupressi]|uniref:Uncharacterized protein n=1 Tax=Arthrobacter cupressi TaxID=1045773 RepID=A0A1G8LIF0_9MICC|nr:hypothetical protein [Arthrobacter cupressi]NYD77616.1 hypothetical protein [Arthrobacter cupressi]SDI55405.1 hypothetical protein SAMN05216555_10374 [Arthrobacter cupressi]